MIVRSPHPAHVLAHADNALADHNKTQVEDRPYEAGQDRTSDPSLVQRRRNAVLPARRAVDRAFNA